jgi:hypothetical protein
LGLSSRAFVLSFVRGGVGGLWVWMWAKRWGDDGHGLFSFIYASHS